MSDPVPCPICGHTNDIAYTDPDGWNHGQYDCETCRGDDIQRDTGKGSR